MFCKGPGYNCEHGLLSAKNKTKLLLSKPTATLHGDANGEPHTKCSPGSCVYRRNLTISESDDGGATWTTHPWGVIYAVRASTVWGTLLSLYLEGDRMWNLAGRARLL